MQIRSDSFQHRGPIPAEFAMGAADGLGNDAVDDAQGHAGDA